MVPASAVFDEVWKEPRLNLTAALALNNARLGHVLGYKWPKDVQLAMAETLANRQYLPDGLRNIAEQTMVLTRYCCCCCYGGV